MLFRSGLPDDDNLEQTLKTLQFDGSDDHLIYLCSARQQISHHFGDKKLSNEPIHILVEVPSLGKCDTCTYYSMLKGLYRASSPAKVSMHSSFTCPDELIPIQARKTTRQGVMTRGGGVISTRGTTK